MKKSFSFRMVRRPFPAGREGPICNTGAGPAKEKIPGKEPVGRPRFKFNVSCPLQ